MSEIVGNRIMLTESKAEDADRFAAFEKAHAEFVCEYSPSRHLQLILDEDALHLSIRKIEDGSLVGHVILIRSANQPHVLEFRRLLVLEKRRGYGREAVQLVKRFCFEVLTLHRLWLDVFTTNANAIRLYESEGFRFEGEMRECLKTGDGYKSLRIYSMLKNEYVPGDMG